MSEQPEYFLGDAVKVRKTVRDPDIEYSNEHGGWWDNVSLVGWVGIIREIEELPDGREMLTLEWDSHTLRNVPDRWKKFCRQEGGTDEEEFGFMVLADEDVQPTDLRDIPGDRQQARRELYAELNWEDIVADLREVMGIDRGINHGDEAWSTRQLRAPLIAHAAQGPDVRRGLNELERLAVSHEFFLHEGTRWVDGERQGDDLTAAMLKDLRVQGLGTIVVRASWDGEDSEGELVRVTGEVVVALTLKTLSAQEKPA